MEKIEIIPYLSFAGNCEEALQAYQKAFGGDILFISRWTEENCETPEQPGKVMHVEFTLGRTRMSGGDSFDTGEVNTDIKLMVHMDTKPQAEAAIAALAEGGMVIAPLRPHPAPDDGGCGSIIRDRFGFTWIITCPNPEKQSC